MTHEKISKIPVAVLGATGMVGQRFIALLENHPWFQVKCVAASSRSAGKSYEEAVGGDWYMGKSIPEGIDNMKVLSVEDDMDTITQRAQVVFCALGIKEKEKIRQIENAYAARGVAVVSNNSAHRWTSDVPMMIPEVNSQHAGVILYQRQKRGWNSGSIAVKPNCSLQSFVPPLDALKQFGVRKVSVVTFQAVSGAGRRLKDWPEMEDNVIPFIPGEEEKTEKEPLKIWGIWENGEIKPAIRPVISASCNRVGVEDGHLAAVSVSFDSTPTREDIVEAIKRYNSKNPLLNWNLPSAPKEFIVFRDEEDRPQPVLDRMAGKGMAITVGRLRKDVTSNWKFTALSHNTIRGAAGGAILTAELLHKKGYI